MPNPVTPPQQFTAVLEDKQVLNDKFIQYSFELLEPHRLNFQAGQYISLQVSEDGQRRAYSILSTPDVDHGIDILVEPVEGGLGTNYLANLNFGDKVKFLAPMGMFTIAENNKEDALAFVVTGSGIAPAKSMILDLLQHKGEQRPIELYWGLRFVNDLVWETEFLELGENFKNFKFHPVISRPVEEWSLCKGRVTDCLQVHQLKPNSGYYICGSSQMIADVKKVLQERHVDPNYIHHEKFDI